MIICHFSYVHREHTTVIQQDKETNRSLLTVLNFHLDKSTYSSPLSNKATLTKGHPSYQTRFRWTDFRKILLNCPPSREVTPSYKAIFHNRRSGFIRELLYGFLHKLFLHDRFTNPMENHHISKTSFRTDVVRR